MRYAKPRMARIRPLIRRLAAAALAVILALGPVGLAWAVPRPLELEDKPEPIDPLKPLADSDRIEALALFAAGRTEEQNENYGAALRLYQRALRFDPTSLAILERIIDLAQQLNRDDVAARYALRAIELDSSDPRRVLAIVMQLTERENYEPALELCRKFRKGVEGKPPKKDVFYLLFTLQTVQLAYLTEQFDEAAEAVREVLVALDDPSKFGIDPARRRELLANEARQYELFGEVFLSAKAPDDALRMFQRVKQLNSNEAVFALHEAQVAMLREKYDDALKRLQVYFDAHEVSHDWTPYRLFESALEKSGRKDELISRLEKLRADDPGNVPLRYFLARRYCDAGQWAKAEPHYRDLLKQSPKRDAYEGLLEVADHTNNGKTALVVLVNVVEKLGNLDAIEKDIERIAKNEKLVDALLDAVRTLKKERSGELDYAAARAAAEVMLLARRLDDASEFFNEAIRAKPGETAELLLAWGQGLTAHEEYAEAAKVFQRGLDDGALPPDSPLFQTYLATVLMLDEQHDKALAAARKAAEIGDHTPFLDSRVALVLYMAKRYDEAVDAYKALIEEHEDDYSSDDTRRVLRDARLTLSNIAVIRKNNAEAEEWLEQVLDEFPDDVGALNDLGYLWADQNKNLDRALVMVRKAVEAEPDNAAYRDSLGWALYRLGKYAEALEELKLATKDEEDVDGIILDHLGDVYLAAGDKAQAVKAWQRAAAKLADEDAMADTLAKIKQKLREHTKDKKEKK